MTGKRYYRRFCVWLIIFAVGFMEMPASAHAAPITPHSTFQIPAPTENAPICPAPPQPETSPPPPLAETDSIVGLPTAGETFAPVPAFSPQLEALRAAAFLLGEGDRLQASDIDAAREKWLAAADAYTDAGDQLGVADAYLRLADSYQAAAIFDPVSLDLAITYYQQVIWAAADVYETLIQKDLTFDQDLLNEAESQYEQGVAAYDAGNCAAATPFFTQARQLYQQADFGSGEMRAIVGIVRCKIDNNDFLGAMLPLFDALTIVSKLPLGSSADERYLEGMDFYEQGRWDEAVTALEEAQAQYEAAGQQSEVAQVTQDLANVYASKGDFPQAQTLYQDALNLFLSIDDEYSLYNQAAAHHNLGNLAMQMGRYEEAIRQLTTAIELWQGIGEPAQEVDSRNSLGLTLREQGNYGLALRRLEEALALQQELPPDSGTEGDLLTNVGSVYYAQGRYEQAILLYQQALSLYQELPLRLKEAQALSNIASAYAGLGRYDEALALYDQVLAIAAASGVPRLTDITQMNIANVQTQRGDYQQALTIYLTILPHFMANGEDPAVASVEANIGAAYQRLGDWENAIAHLSVARSSADTSGNLSTIGDIRNNLGAVAVAAGDYANGEACLQQSLDIWQVSNNQVAAGRVLGNLALLSVGENDFSQSVTWAEEGIHLNVQNANQADLGRLWLALGLGHFGMGDAVSALADGRQVVRSGEESGDLALEMAGHVLVAGIYEINGDTPTAYAHAQTAVARLEALQGLITVAELKTMFFNQLVDAYTLAVELAVKQGLFEDAFHLAEQARARAFLDQVVNGQVNFRLRADSALLAEEQTLREQLAARRTQLITLRAQSGTDDNVEAIAAVTAEIEGLEENYTDLLLRLQLLSPETGSLFSVEAASLAEIQQNLLPDTTLVSYFVLSDSSLAFVLTADSFTSVSLPAGRQALLAQVETLRLTDFARLDETHLTSLRQLYDWLIAPLLPHLQTGRLIIVPHNVLHYVPFAALTDGERHLLDDYTLTSLPTAGILRFLVEKRKPEAGSLLAMGGPTSDEPGLGVLRSAPKEVETIATLFNSRPFLGAAATESEVVVHGGRNNILHLAAHGKYNAANPLFSTIYLAADDANDGRLTVQEIYELDLNSATNLVTLSACETQVGEFSAGDEVVALNRAFLYAGTPSVIASLWNVNDEATALLMERFYTHWRNGLSKAAALRQAQIDTRRQYPHPYYWAGFVLTGDGGDTIGVLPAATRTPELSVTASPALSMTTTPVATNPAADPEENAQTNAGNNGQYIALVFLIVAVVVIIWLGARRK